MELIFDLPNELKSVNPNNILIPFDWSFYRIDYNYSTCRGNLKNNSKYFLIPNKTNIIVENYIGDNLCYQLLHNSDIFKNMIKENIIKESFLKWINNFNIKNPFRSLSNIEIINISKEPSFISKISKNKLILECENIDNINPKDIINIYPNIEINEVKVSYTTNNGNKKIGTRFILNQHLDSYYYNDLLTSYENIDLNTILKSYYNKINFQNTYAENKKIKASNVKILDVLNKYSLSF